MGHRGVQDLGRSIGDFAWMTRLAVQIPLQRHCGDKKAIQDEFPSKHNEFVTMCIGREPSHLCGVSAIKHRRLHVGR
jgi:hypothetical protein